jgi:hypothetical protein
MAQQFRGYAWGTRLAASIVAVMDTTAAANVTAVATSPPYLVH